ncbi:hypothetical protein RYZ26_11250 [Terasakiella sp. A23]|uniref:hypothetical protein n=1 Tax=Terasakiella sp. FCG-A23 TaxID=3080561 RepID=UPI002955072A|nr:hypothetical protein [Terasakiella sp. A23]MDV7340173.1 hypothetical protein [Terasakiella sp. A23]
MNIGHTGSIRKISFRFSLLMGMCVLAHQPSMAQTNTFDPFAPTAVAPTEPTAVPTAPTPVAPKLPPRPAPMPEPVVAEPIAPAAAPEPVMAEPVVTAEPVTPPASVETTPASEPSSSFFDRLGKLFEDDEEEQQKKVEEKPEPEVVKEEPVQQPEIATPPKPEPVVEKSRVVEVKPAAPVAPVVPKSVAAPKPEPAPVLPTVAADQNNTDPFASTSVAPHLPTAPQAAPTVPAQIVQQPEPVIIKVPERRMVVAPEPAPTPEPTTKPVIETETEVVKPVEPPKEEKAVVAEQAPVQEEDSPSFFERLGNLFSSEPEEPSPVVETAKPIKEIEQIPEPAAKPEPETYQVVEDIEYELPGEPEETTLVEAKPEPVPDVKAEPVAEPEPVPEVVEKTVPEPVEEPVAPAQPTELVKQVEPETLAPETDTTDTPGFFERIGKMLSSEETKAASEKITEAEPAALEPSLIEAAKPTPSAEPFDLGAVAPNTPVEAPKAVSPIEPAKPKAETPKSTGGFFNFLTGGDDPEPSNAELVQPEERVIVVEPEPTPEPAVVVEERTPRPLIAKTIKEEPGFFESIGNFFSSPFSSENDKKEKAQTVNPAPAVEAPKPEEVTPPEPPKPVDPRLVQAKLGLGRDIKLGQSDNDLSRQARCFTKNRGTVAYCLTPTRWPVEIATHFDVSTHLYKGAQGITQYDGDIATRLFTLFNESGFDDIIAYYEKAYGPATNQFVRKTRTFRKGYLDNPTYVWRKENTDEGLTEVFEIRKIADTRGGVPDLQRGSVRVYFEGSREIFALTSDLDYMDLN